MGMPFWESIFAYSPALCNLGSVSAFFRHYQARICAYIQAGTRGTRDHAAAHSAVSVFTLGFRAFTILSR